MKTATKCYKADRYKATRPPTCGCDLCILKWEVAELKRSNVKLMAQLEKVSSCARSAVGSASTALYVANLPR